MPIAARTDGATQQLTLSLLFSAGLFFHVVGEGVVNLARKAENVTDKENYIDFRLRLLGEPGKFEASCYVVTANSLLTIEMHTILMGGNGYYNRDRQWASVLRLFLTPRGSCAILGRRRSSMNNTRPSSVTEKSEPKPGTDRRTHLGRARLRNV